MTDNLLAGHRRVGSLILLRNTRRRSLRWAIMPGRIVLVAPGDVFEVHEGELEHDGGIMGDVLRIFVRKGWIVIEETDLLPLLH